MNTKIITFCVFATLFMGAYVALCSIGLSGNACAALWLSILSVTAAILCTVADYHVENCKIRSICNKVTEQESKIKKMKSEVEGKKVPAKEASPADVQKHNGELQDLLKKLTDFGEALNQVKKELNEIAKKQKSNKTV